MIWDYQYSIAEDILKSYQYFEINNCPFCKAKLFQLSADRYSGGSYLGAGLSGDYGDQGKQLQVCQTCGWWVITRKEGYTYGSYEGSLSIQRGCGCLKSLDNVEINEIPLKELRKYLIAKYDTNKLMNGRRFEELVFSIFKDFKYDVVLTEYSGDKGIDLILAENQNSELIGIQVKRYKNKIEADKIREFAGSLILNNMTKGVFITTSDFRKGAKQTASEFGNFNIKIDLINSEKFYNLLKLSQRNVFDSPEDSEAGFYKFWKDISLLPVVFSRSW